MRLGMPSVHSFGVLTIVGLRPPTGRKFHGILVIMTLSSKLLSKNVQNVLLICSQRRGRRGRSLGWLGMRHRLVFILAHWASEDFWKISTQNKTNRTSAKGGAIQTIGSKSHNDVALDMGV